MVLGSGPLVRQGGREHGEVQRAALGTAQTPQGPQAMTLPQLRATERLGDWQLRKTRRRQQEQ